jgi:hypothetical protein
MPVDTYDFLDLVPKGRDEAELSWTIARGRHQGRCGDGNAATAPFF